MKEQQGKANKRVYLNIGCGEKKIPGFVNIDLEPGADIQLDVRGGLPFPDSSVDGVFSEHFIEHISQAEGVNFFRECRRVLKPGGRVRIATPDLEYIIKRYLREDWKSGSEMFNHGMDYVQNTCEQLNLVMRSWGHQWLYSEEELVRVASVAGLKPLQRCAFGESEWAAFSGLEYREGSRLIYEFAKLRPEVRDDQPLVSILIASYKPRFFREALESALNQTYRNLEILICDDCPDDAIEKIAAEYQAGDKRIVYHRNDPPLGGRKNYLKCFELASGEYIKFLNDDDLLAPQCVEQMVDCLNKYPEVTLVTSRRQLIDQHGNPLPDTRYTAPPTPHSSIIDGLSLGNFVMKNQLNVIGEPSTVMFRKEDLWGIEPNIFSIGGRPALANGDLTMWMNLLSRGKAIYLAEILSSFRQHDQQVQQQKSFTERALKAWDQLRFDAGRMGFLSELYPAKESVVPLKQPETSIQPAPRQERPAKRPAGSQVRVSIIIPVFNKVEFTEQCLQYLYQNTSAEIGFEVIVVDNASRDGTAAFLRQARGQYANLRVITNKKNRGFSGACNQGARKAKGAYLLFLNNDTEPKPHWLEPLLEVLDLDARVAAVGSKLLFPDGTIQHAGVVVVEDHQINDPVAPRHIHYRRAADSPKVNELRTYKVLTAACLLVRKSVFNEVDGFDEGYWNGYEDVDLCFKIHTRGWKLVYQPRSVLIHYEKQSGAERFRKANDNIKRLHQLWQGKIIPDYILRADGSVQETEDNQIKLYQLPRPSTAPAVPSAVKVPAVKPFVSIIILTFNQLPLTKECLDSIARYTRGIDYEVIVVDNGSKDKTPAYLKRWAKKSPNHHIILNKTNKGFAGGNNQGVKKAKGNYLLLMNNDIVVSEGWLTGMVEAINRDASVGVVGPMTNFISGRQQEKEVAYKTLDEFHAFAKAYREKNRGRVLAVHRLVGFCMMIKKEVIEKIGVLDERFGKGNFEDDDFCLRAILEGYRLAIAREVFVHHYGNSSFTGNNLDYVEMFSKNREIFLEKWKDLQEPLPIWLEILLEKACWEEKSGNYDGQEEALAWAFRIGPGRKEIAEAYEKCLRRQGKPEEAFRALQQYLAVHPDDAEGQNLLGMYHWERHQPGEAIQAFERAVNIDPEKIEYWQNLAEAYLAREQFEQAIEGYYRIMEKFPDDVNAYHKLAALYIEGGKYETARQLLQRASRIAPENRAVKELRELVDVPEVFQARQLAVQGESPAARELLEKVLYRDQKTFPQTGFLLLAELLLADGPGGESDSEDQQFQRLLNWLEKALASYAADRERFRPFLEVIRDNFSDEHYLTALRLYTRFVPDDPQTLYTLGRALFAAGETDAAEEALRKAAELNPADPNPFKELVELYLHAERFEPALLALRQLIESFPGDVQAYLQLADLYAEAGELAEAEELIRFAATISPEDEAQKYRQALLADPSLYLAAIWLEQGELAAAEELITRGLENDPHNQNAQFLKARLSLARGDLESAQQLFETLLGNGCEETNLLLNLENIYLQTEQFANFDALWEKMDDSLREKSQFRKLYMERMLAGEQWDEGLLKLDQYIERFPDDPEGYLLLTRVNLHHDRPEEAHMSWQQARRLAPYHPGVLEMREILSRPEKESPVEMAEND